MRESEDAPALEAADWQGALVTVKKKGWGERVPASRLEIRSLGASGSAGIACLRLAWGLGGVCARVRGRRAGSSPASSCASARPGVGARAGAERTAKAAGSLGYLSRSVLGGCAQISGRQQQRRDVLSSRGGAEKLDPGPDRSGGEQSMEQRSGRAGESQELFVSATGQGVD